MGRILGCLEPEGKYCSSYQIALVGPINMIGLGPQVCIIYIPGARGYEGLEGLYFILLGFCK